MKLLLRLYPKDWRLRYDDEVATMLDDSQSGPRDAPDLVRGALDAHMHPEPLGLPSGRIRGWFSLERSAALVAIVSGVAWLLPQVTLSILTANYSQRDDLMGPLAAVALPGVLAAVAMAGLLFRHVVELRVRLIAVTAVALVGMGSMAMIATGLGMPYGSADAMLPGSVAVLVGSLVGVVAMWGRAPVGRRSLLWVALACVLELVYLASVPDGSFWFALDSAISAGIGVAVGFAWISVGRSALALGSPSRGQLAPGVAVAEAA